MGENVNREAYLRRIREILDDDSCDEPTEVKFTFNEEPTKLTDTIYLGGYSDADNLGLLSSLGVTHLLNCADIPTNRDHAFYVDCRKDFIYKDLDAHDRENYDMTQHFYEAAVFINDCHKSGGKVLVYCRRGMNRSVTICIAYLMRHHSTDLLTAVQKVKRKRGRILTNPSFQEQLLRYAYKIGCLIE